MQFIKLPSPPDAALHPAKTEPAAGLAAKVPVWLLSRLGLQEGGQTTFAPLGVLRVIVTVPLPVPARMTVRVLAAAT